jgi:hypothetical protein
MTEAVWDMPLLEPREYGIMSVLNSAWVEKMDIERASVWTFSF